MEVMHVGFSVDKGEIELNVSGDTYTLSQSELNELYASLRYLSDDFSSDLAAELEHYVD